MASKNLILAGLVAVALAGAFWLGAGFYRASYLDRCLDLGGGRYPGGYPICVVEQPARDLHLGPVRIAPGDILEAEIAKGAEGQSQVVLRLKPEVAGALAGYTEQAVGQNLDIRIGGKVIRSVHIAEPIDGGEVLIVLSQNQADRLAEILTPD